MGVAQNEHTLEGVSRVLAEVSVKRSYQIEKWGRGTDDEKNNPMAFVGYISHYGTRWFNGGFQPYDKATLENFRASMIDVAAIAVAAVQYTDRLLAEVNVRPDVYANEG